MNSQKKSSRYQTVQLVPKLKPDSILFRLTNKKRNLNESYNKSLEEHFLHHHKQSRYESYQEQEDPTKKINTHDEFKFRIQKKKDNSKLRQNSVKSANSQSQQSHKHKFHPQKSNQKISLNTQLKNTGKSPTWIKCRKKQINNQILNNISIVYEPSKQQVQGPIYKALSGKQMNRFRSQNLINIPISQFQNMQSIQPIKANLQYINSNILLNQNSLASRQSILGRNFDPKIQNMHQIQLQNIKLLQQIEKQKNQIQNLHEDKNIIYDIMKTLQTQLNTKQKILNEQTQVHRAIQQKLKEKIKDLENKLVQAKDQINTKSQFLDTDVNQGNTNSSNDRQVIQKKNEQISRLNEIINKNRSKINQLYQQITEQRIANHHNIIMQQQKNEFLHDILKKKEMQIMQLQKKIQQFKLKQVSQHPTTTHIVNNNGNFSSFRYFNNLHITENSRKSDEEQLKKVVSLTSLHKQPNNSNHNHISNLNLHRIKN